MKDKRDVTQIKTCSCRKIVGTKRSPSLCPRAQGRKAWSQSRRDPNLSPPDSAREGPFVVIPRLDTKYHEEGISITNCVRGPKDHPQFRGFSRRTHKTKHIFVVTAVIHDNERCEAVEKAHGIKSGENQAQDSESSAMESHRRAHSSGTELWQHLWRGVLWSSLGLGYLGSRCLAHSKISDQWKERRCSAWTRLFAQTVQA